MAASCLLAGRLWLWLTPDLVAFSGVVFCLLFILYWSAKQKKAATSSDWDKAVARWSRVCKMGMEAALREAGCSKARSVYIVGRIRSQENFNLDYLKNHKAPVRAVLLATLGRGSTPVKRLWSHTEPVPPWSKNEAAALCVNLSSNANIVELQLNSVEVLGTVKGCTLLGHALAMNSSVIHLNLSGVGMGHDGVRCLLDGLQSNTSLKALHLDNNRLFDEGVRSVAEFLSNNATLKVLHLTATGGLLEGAIHMSSALGTNTALQTLGFGVLSVPTEGVKRLLEPLSLDDGNEKVVPNGPKNTSLEGLHLSGGDGEHVESLTHLIKTNKSLRALGFRFNRFRPTDWKDLIFPALKDNVTLTELIFEGSIALTEFIFDGSIAHDTLMRHYFWEPLFDLIQNSSTGLEKITLDDSQLKSSQGQVNQMLWTNKMYRSRLRGEPEMKITSGRIVLCGYEFAGKTEISKTMKRIENGTSLGHSFRMGVEKLIQLYRARTRGFKVVTLHKQPYIKSIWDFAGQKEYYALHDYVFPDMKNSYFLYVCSCRSNPKRGGKVKDKMSIQAECEYWMRFLASNSKPIEVSQGRQLPRVMFVLTKTDTLDSPEQKTKIISIAEDVVHTLKRVFANVLDLSETVEVVNARSSQEVKRLLMASNDNLRAILADQKEYYVCQQVRELLEGWSRSNPSKPVLRLNDFYRLCEEQIRYYQDLGGKLMVVLAYLNDVGEIIYPRQCDFIVTNPSWFGINVLGSLINAFKEEDPLSYCLYHVQGFVKRQDMNDHLERSLRSMDLKQSIPVEKLMDLMIRLELCFEAEPEQADSLLFVPALFDDKEEFAAKGQRQLEWKLVPEGGLEYLGRRLECQDRSTTFLTPGFFPRLQVHLRNYIHEEEWTKNPGFAVERNLICFAENGVEVCVEYAGDNDDYIDILVRSSKPYADALKFIDEHVVNIIRTFCASPKGCQGVVLVESVIRPVCVRELHRCIDRKEHSVLVSKLESELARDNTYKHIWKTGLPFVSGTDMAIDLLKGEGSQNRMGQWLEISNGMVSSSSNVDDLPKLFYPTIEDVGILRQLGTRLNLTRVIPIKLHILCDHPHGSHKVEGQPGRTITLKARSAGSNVPAVIGKVARTLLWGGVGVAGKVVGVPVPVEQASNWVESLFSVPQLPLDGETVHRRMRTSNGRPCKRLSQEEIVTALERFWKRDPHTQGLIEILKLEDGTKFLKDFQLHKVVYTDGTIGWVCKSHYEQGFKDGILRSKPHFR